MMRPDAACRVYLHREPVDFRLAINGLSLRVAQQFALDPFCGALFVFCNRQRNKIKILYWERNGFCLWQKRLEQETFRWPKHLAEETVSLSSQELCWLLDGFDLWRNPPHKILNYSSLS